MQLRSEEVRSIIHQVIDQLYDAGFLILEDAVSSYKQRTFAVKLRWCGMKIPIGHILAEDSKNPS